jgi:hypothetical protein
MESVEELQAWLPAEQFFRQSVAGHAIHRPCWHVRQKLDLGLVPRVAQHLFRRVDDSRALHGAQVEGGAVVDLVRGKDDPLDDVADAGPVPDLRAVSPDFVYVLAEDF